MVHGPSCGCENELIPFEKKGTFSNFDFGDLSVLIEFCPGKISFHFQILNLVSSERLALAKECLQEISIERSWIQQRFLM